MNIQEKVDQLVSEFKSINDWEDRYKKIISMGKDLPAMNQEHQIDANKVKGCQSQVWLYAQMNPEGKVEFEADSDASIVKGIISLLLFIYSNQTPEDILKTKPDFLETIGLREHLSMSRSNGLSSMLKQISMYALALKAKRDMGV